MKLMNKLFAALVLFGMSNAVFGYDFSIENMTSQPIQLAVKVKGGKSIAKMIQTRNKTMPSRETFSFTGSEAALCLEYIEVNGKKVAIMNMAELLDPAFKATDTPLCRDTDFEIFLNSKNEFTAIYE
jgi:hypothetical protein